ncbi:MAG: hypothetical protein II255_01500 [Ruminiclostridium sp.]|nr:hypothetical protein [Ruminiclostridium sp.]
MKKKQDPVGLWKTPDLQPGRDGMSCLSKGVENEGKGFVFCEGFGGQMGSGQLFPGEEKGSSLGKYIHKVLQRCMYALIIPERTGRGKCNDCQGSGKEVGSGEGLWYTIKLRKAIPEMRCLL